LLLFTFSRREHLIFREKGVNDEIIHKPRGGSGAHGVVGGILVVKTLCVLDVVSIRGEVSSSSSSSSGGGGGSSSSGGGHIGFGL
jgi:hypothetical protein